MLHFTHLKSCFSKQNRVASTYVALHFFVQLLSLAIVSTFQYSGNKYLFIVCNVFTWDWHCWNSYGCMYNVHCTALTLLYWLFAKRFFSSNCIDTSQRWLNLWTPIWCLKAQCNGTSDPVQRNGLQETFWQHVPLQKLWNGRISGESWKQQSCHKVSSSSSKEGEGKADESSWHFKEGHWHSGEHQAKQGGIILLHTFEAKSIPFLRRWILFIHNMKLIS